MVLTWSSSLRFVFWPPNVSHRVRTKSLIKYSDSYLGLSEVCHVCVRPWYARLLDVSLLRRVVLCV